MILLIGCLVTFDWQSNQQLFISMFLWVDLFMNRLIKIFIPNRADASFTVLGFLLVLAVLTGLVGRFNIDVQPELIFVPLGLALAIGLFTVGTAVG